MAVIASKCPEISVTVFDISAERIAAWNSNELPIYEPGLSEIVEAARGKNLTFTTDDNCIAEADLIFISVNTPTKVFGEGKGRAANLAYVESCSKLIATKIKHGHKVIVEKSTVPVRCSVAIRKVLDAQSNGVTDATFSIVSNPEFLAEGTAISDLITPDRVLIGGEQGQAGVAAVELLASVYRRWVPDERIIRTNCWSSELAKLIANAMLAQRISSINSVSAICEATGADVSEVSRAIGCDKRIGNRFLQPSIGFGGSCFQKDILNLVYLCETLNLPEVAEYWHNVVRMNDYQRSRFSRNIVKTMFDCVEGKVIAIFGFAFKKNTGDTRESSAITVCSALLEEGAFLRIYDPKVTEKTLMSDLVERCDTQRARDLAKKNVTTCGSALAASFGAAAIVILTEWDEFHDSQCDYRAHFAQMARPAYIFDGRLMADPQNLRAIGFEAFCIGRPATQSQTSSFFFHSN